MLIKHRLESIAIELTLVHQDMIMSRSRGPLDGCVRTKIEIVLKWMCNVLLYQGTRDGVSVFVRSWRTMREKTYVMALLSNYHGELDLYRQLA